MALSPTVAVSIKHKQIGSDRLPWYTTYFLRTLALADMPYGVAQAMIQEICDFEATLYYDTVQILGGTATKYVAPTIVPNPNPPPYDPSAHTGYNVVINGARGLAGEQLYYDQVVDIIRNSDYGNPGHLEIRGALTEGEVQTTLGQKSLTTSAATAWAARVSLFAAGIESAAAGHDVEFLLIGVPLISTERFVDDDNKFREVKTYGAAYFRPINSWGLGTVRTDKGFNKYFDRGL